MKIVRSPVGIWFIKYRDVALTSSCEVDIWQEGVRRGLSLGLILGALITVCIFAWIVLVWR